MNKPTRSRVAGVLSLVATGAALLQPRAAAQPASAPVTSGEIVQLREFTVAEEKDTGYSTTNAIGVTRTNTAIIDTPQSLTVINQEFLRDAQAGELYDVLKYVSGVSIESNVGDSVMIRGYTVRGQYTDGFSDTQTQSSAGADPFLFERLEVLKGPSALAYGSHAAGGVLNRVRKSPSWKTGGSASLMFGNHAQEKAELDYTAPLNNRIAYRLVGIYRSEDLSNNVETRFSWFKRWNLNPSVTWRVSNTTQLKVVGEFMREEGFKHWGDNAQLQPFVFNGATTFGLLPRDFTFSDPRSRNDNNKRAVFAALETVMSPNWSIRIAAYNNHWRHEVTEDLPSGIQVNNRLMGRTARFISNYDTDYSVGVDSVYNFHAGPSEHKFLVIGQHYSSDNNTATVTGDNPPALDILNPVYTWTGLTNPRTTTKTLGAGSNTNLSFQDQARFFEDKLQLIVGTRFDRYASHTDNLLTSRLGARNKGENWTYKGGAIAKPRKDLAIFYNYAETYNANFGSNPDGTTFVPSNGVVNEIGLKSAMKEGRITGTVSYFDLQLKHILGLDPDPVRASAGYQVQQARQVTRGVEADVVFNLRPGWDLSVSGSTMSIELPTKLLPRNAPEKTAAAWTRYRFPAGALKGVTIGGGWNWQGRAAADTTNQIFFPPAGTFDGFVQYAWKGYRFSLNGSNLTDKWYLKRGVNRNIFWSGPERLIKFRVGRAF